MRHALIAFAAFAMAFSIQVREPVSAAEETIQITTNAEAKVETNAVADNILSMDAASEEEPAPDAPSE